MKPYDIDIKLSASVPAARWQIVAMREARKQAKAIGLDWAECTVFVQLPERCRCFVKYRGVDGFTAYG